MLVKKISLCFAAYSPLTCAAYSYPLYPLFLPARKQLCKIPKGAFFIVYLLQSSTYHRKHSH